MSADPAPPKITSPTLHVTILFTLGVFAALLTMSFVFKVEVVARGTGRVVPVGRVQIVQPEFAGRITAIHVSNGPAVERGDVLIELDPTDAISQLGTIQVEADRLRIEMARIEAIVTVPGQGPEATDLTDQALAVFKVPAALAGHPFATQQQRLLHAEVKDLQSSLGQIAAQDQANRRSEAVTNANITRLEAARDIPAERPRTSEQLLQQGTASRAAFLDVQQAFTELEREREAYLRELEQKVGERATLANDRRRLFADQRKSLLDRKAAIDARLATLVEEARAAQRRVDAATLKTPVSGLVDQLSVFTIGGVAEDGEELLRIVPTHVPVEVESTFPNQDIGFMSVGQQANIGPEACPSERFGFVQGQVSDIAADSTEVT